MVDPEGAARLGVERHDVVGRLREVHNAVDDQRRRLEFLQRLGLEDPLQLKILDVCGVDLFEGAVALAGVAAGVGQPVLWLVGGMEQALGRDLRAERVGNQRNQKNSRKVARRR